MGHSSTRMVDKVYGRLDDSTLAAAMGQLANLELGEVPRGSGAAGAGRAAGRRLARGPAEPADRHDACIGSKHGSSHVESGETGATPGQTDVCLGPDAAAPPASSKPSRMPHKVKAPVSFHRRGLRAQGQS